MIDFSCAKVVTNMETTMTIVASSLFSAPESMTVKYSTPVDMWSCGVLTYCLLCGYLPFDGPQFPDVVERIRKAHYDFLQHDWNHVSSDAHDFIKSLIRLNPTQRLNAEQVLQHEWIAKGAPRANKSTFSTTYFRKLCCGPPRVKEFKNMVLKIIHGT